MRYNITLKTLVGILIVLFGFIPAILARRVNVSDTIPLFTIVDTEGGKMEYPNDKKAVLLIAFASPSKPQSFSAWTDLERVIGSIENYPIPLSVIYITDEPNSLSSLNVQALPASTQITKHVVLDSDYRLWGKFGVIASPTVFLAGPDQRITMIKAGYGYDFAPVIKSNLLQVLGLIDKESVGKASEVKTVRIDTDSQKAFRHLKMAKMLEEQQRYEKAVNQLEQAIRIDPNSVECVLELGRLYCIISKPRQAIELVEGTDVILENHRALRCFILGKGHLLLHEYDSAEHYLIKSLEQDNKNPEAYYLLGRVYHIKKNFQKATQAYYNALLLVFNSYE